MDKKCVNTEAGNSGEKKRELKEKRGGLTGF